MLSKTRILFIIFSDIKLSVHESMDKIFDRNIIEQESILCKTHPEILKIISESLPPNDVVHLSHTCKELHQKLPFYLKKSGTFTILTSLKAYSLFEGPASDFSISEINVSFTVTNSTFQTEHIAVWIQIIRSGIVVLETQKYFIKDTERNHRIKIKDATLKEYKSGDRLRFMGRMKLSMFHIFFSERMNCSFQVSFRLENYKYWKPIDITKKVKGYSDFKHPSVSIDIEDVSVSCEQSCEDIHLSLHGLLENPTKGNTKFWIIKVLDFIFDSTTSFLFLFMESKY